MKVLIVDDEPLARSLLRTLLEDCGGIEVVGEGRDAREAVGLARRLRPDAIFLDIDMPGGSGVAAAHELSRNCPAEIVFVTAHDRYATDAFDLGATDYVLKPVRLARVAQALDRVRKRLDQRSALAPAQPGRGEEAAFWVRTQRGKVRVAACDIVWIEAARDHVHLHTPGGSFMHRITMAKLEAALEGTPVVRVQRSAFASLDRVTRVVRRGKSAWLELDGPIRVPIGRSYQARIFSILSA